MSSTSSFGSGVFGTGPLGTQPFFNVSEMIDGVLSSTGHSQPATETTKRRAILQFINNRYQDVCLGRHWRWFKASYDFMLEAPYSTGTVSTVQGDDAVTGLSTAWSAVNAPIKGIFFLGGSSVVYHVSTLASATSLTLETDFAEDDVTDGGYTIAKNQYVLPAETDNILSFVVNSNLQLRPLGVNDFRQMQATNPIAMGQPIYFCPIRRDTDDDQVYIEVWPAPDKKYQCQIDYTVRIARLNDSITCYPIIPDRYRAVLFYGALAEFYGFMRDPVNREKAETDYQRFLTKMMGDTQLTDQALVFKPSVNYVRRSGPASGRPFRSVSMTIQEFGSEG